MKKFILQILRAPETITVVLLAIAIFIGMSRSNTFLSYAVYKSSLTVPIGFGALAMTFIIITGQIDLSVASGALLTMVISGLAYRHGFAMPVVIGLALFTGCFLGLVNGLLIALLRLPSLVVTLGTLALYRGLAEGLIGDGTVKEFPKWFTGIDNVTIAKLLGQNASPRNVDVSFVTGLLQAIPLPPVLLLLTALVAALALHFSTFGRRVYAVGTSEPAARYSGINTRAITVAVYTLSGLTMGIAALIQMSMLGVVDAQQFRGEELIAITSVVLGGTSIFGGRGTILGTVLALCLIVSVGTVMGQSNIKIETRLVVMGTLLISSVLLTSLTAKLFATRRT